MLIEIVRILLIILSWMGYSRTIEKRLNNIYIAPMIAMAGQITVLFIAGLLNVLLFGVIAVFAGGLILFAMELKHDAKTLFKTFAREGFVFYAISVVLAYVAVKGDVLTAYDDFSHWGFIVRQMLLNDSYPTFDIYIMFQAYPPGSATFIYYFARLAGGGEDIWLFAQALMIISCILPIFSFSREKHPVITVAFALLATNFIFVFNILILSLYVDTLLAMAGAGTMLYFYRCRDDMSAKAVMAGMPLLTMCLLIKNSGIFFALICCIYILYYSKNIKDKKLVVSLIIPFVLLLLWHRHCDMVFHIPELSKHAMTPEYAKAMIGSKTPGYIFWLTKRVILASLQGNEFYLTLVLMALSFVVVALAAPQLKKTYFKLLFVSAVLYTAYQIGMLLMYIFSMTAEQAYGLAAFDRYRKTVLAVIVYMAVALNIRVISECSYSSLRPLAAVCVAFATLIGTWRMHCGGFQTIFRDIEFPLREQLEGLLEEYDVPEEASYYMCMTPNSYAGVELFLCPYLTLTGNVSGSYHTDVEDLEYAKEYFQYLLIMDENPLIQEWIAENFPEQHGKKVIEMEPTSEFIYFWQ